MPRLDDPENCPHVMALSPKPAAFRLSFPDYLVNRDAAVYIAIATAALVLWQLCQSDIAALPFIAPWDFSFIEFLAGWLTLFWYVRGLHATPAKDRPSAPRQVLFFAGLAAIYFVLETRFEYLAEHQFFFNRMQHIVMHHIGPLLLALSWPGETLALGVPAWILQLSKHRAVIKIINVLQQPVIAGLLFVGLIFFWLIPSVHFRAMIDPRLFTIMNWSMLIDGMLFWFLVLDPRPSPPARTSFLTRTALALLVMLPQIVGGAFIALSRHEIYPYYDLCGRIYPGLGPLYDQMVGGIIVWIPSSMMSVLAVLLVLNMLRLYEERTLAHANIADWEEKRPAFDSSLWTGR